MSEYDVTPRLGPIRDQGNGAMERFDVRVHKIAAQPAK